jgi:hypothetical protein
MWLWRWTSPNLEKRKYHQCNRVEGVWVVGAVERTPQRKMFAISIDDRSRETLHAMIER